MNLLVDENYHIKMADFGAVSLAQAIQTPSVPEQPAPEPKQECTGNGTNSKCDTVTAEVQDLQQHYGATLFCLAPEVLVDHKPYTAESDIYALSMVFYELFVEKMPFEGLGSMQLMRAVDEVFSSCLL